MGYLRIVPGFLAGLAAIGVALWGPGFVGHDMAVAAETGQVTVIPGVKPSERPDINFNDAKPLPLPSVEPPDRSSELKEDPRPHRHPGTSAPGSHGNGEKHPESLPPR